MFGYSNGSIIYEEIQPLEQLTVAGMYQVMSLRNPWRKAAIVK